jgi:hypothetical protein
MHHQINLPAQSRLQRETKIIQKIKAAPATINARLNRIIQTDMCISQ